MKSVKIKRTDKLIIGILIAVLALAAVFSFLSKSPKSSSAQEPARHVTYKDYIGKKIGVLTGTNMEQAAHEFFPDSQYMYYDGYPDMNAALESGMIDAYLAGTETASFVANGKIAGTESFP